MTATKSTLIYYYKIEIEENFDVLEVEFVDVCYYCRLFPRICTLLFMSSLYNFFIVREFARTQDWKQTIYYGNRKNSFGSSTTKDASDIVV
jgi:hypothetical protein